MLLVEALLKDYGKMGCRIFMEVLILDAHLDIFKENVGVFSRGARQALPTGYNGRRYLGAYVENMMCKVM